MSANTVITSLQQAKNCAGKCDCCVKLQNQINQLKAEIKTIPRINEKAIIKKTEASLLPRIEGLVLPLINFKINPIKAVQTKQLANQRALLERVFRAESAARTAGTTAKAAQSTATNAGARAGSALSRIAGLALSIAALVGVAATVKLLESRSNGIEKQVDSVATDLSKAFGFIFQNRQKIDGNSSVIKKNKQKIADVNDAAYSAQQQATQAREIGQKAQSTANQASQKSDRNFDLIKPLQLGLSGVIVEVNKIIPRILKTEDVANQAQTTANKATSTANKADSTANKANTVSNKGLATATTANSTANKANSTANKANSTANKALSLIQPLSQGLGSAFTQINQTFITSINAQNVAKNAQRTANKNQITIKKTNSVDAKKLDKIDKKLDLLPGLFVARASSTLGKPLTVQETVNAAKTGTCNALNGGCTNKLRSQISNQIQQGNNGLFNKINAGFGATNTALNNKQIGLLNTINTKLGAQVPGGLSGTFGRLWQTLQIDRVLNMLTYITTLHNAMMLSNNISQTLFSAIDNMSQSVGFKWKDEKGSDVGFGTIVSQWTTNFFKGLFGAENYNAMTAAYKKANRIYQAGANIINSVRSMLDSVRNISEFLAENTGRIGNALKRYGVVGDDAYKSMPERVDGRSIWLQRLEHFQETAGALEMITGEIASVAQNVNEIQQQTQIFQQSISDSPTKTQTENTAVKTKESTEKTQSQSPVIPQSAERNP